MWEELEQIAVLQAVHQAGGAEGGAKLVSRDSDVSYLVN